MIYIDTSSFLKQFITEPESAAVDTAVGAERTVIFTPLTQLECEVQLRTMRIAREITAAKERGLLAAIEALTSKSPYLHRSPSAELLSAALRQHRKDAKVQCRTLDRLHLAAMEDLGVRRLMTNDKRQANAAATFGFEILVPGAALSP